MRRKNKIENKKTCKKYLQFIYTWNFIRGKKKKSTSQKSTTNALGQQLIHSCIVYANSTVVPGIIHGELIADQKHWLTFVYNECLIPGTYITLIYATKPAADDLKSALH